MRTVRPGGHCGARVGRCQLATAPSAPAKSPTRSTRKEEEATESHHHCKASPPRLAIAARGGWGERARFPHHRWGRHKPPRHQGQTPSGPREYVPTLSHVHPRGACTIDQPPEVPDTTIETPDPADATVTMTRRGSVSSCCCRRRPPSGHTYFRCSAPTAAR